jgi:hypothetical protein
MPCPLIWSFYRNLKSYAREPTSQRKAALSAEFDRISTHKTAQRPAPTHRRLGTISAPGSLYRASPKFPIFWKSSATAALPPDRHGFCLCYAFGI